VYGFLNTFLVELDKAWMFLGTCFYAFFSFYLMLCVIKGNVKVGLGIACFTLHPMELGATLMQSFLVNTLLLAMCSFSVVQFCMQAFKGYAGPNSASTAIFNVAARNLKGITVLYTNNVFIYILLAFALLTLCALCMMPSPEVRLDKELQKAVDEDTRSGFKGKGASNLQKRTNMEMDKLGVGEAARL